MSIPIIYEDLDIIVIDKPAGVVTNRSETSKELTVQDWASGKLGIKAHQPEITNENDFYKRAGIVHRLDKETSGVLVIAKNPKSFAYLQLQFKNRETQKNYTALVHGTLSEEGTIKATVGRLPWNRERFGVIAGGREAVTEYKIQKHYKFLSNSYTLLTVIPHTGRTHQIRIHLKYIGHPIVADPFYAGRKVYRQDKQFCPRLFLHAKMLGIKRPVDDKRMEFTSKLPEELNDVLMKMSTISPS